MRVLLANERGYAAIAIALIFPVLCGFIGLVIDLGYFFIQKQQVQNAVDLAALGAVQKVEDSNQAVESTAIILANENGLHADEVTVVYPYQGDSFKVELKAKRSATFIFLPILGIGSKEITARAVAQMKITTEQGTGTGYQAFDYAVFHGSEATDLQIKGTNSAITGNVHSNKKAALTGSHTINGSLTAVGGISGDLSGVSGTVNAKTAVVPMPDLQFDEYVSKADKVYNTSQTFSQMNISGILYVHGDVTINGGKVSGKGMILASGNIKVASSGLQYSSSNDLLALYSQGNIQIASTGSQIQGVLYAPNGQIQISGSGNTFYGALIAKEIWWSAKEITINGNYDLRTPQAFGTTVEEIWLIE